MPDAPTSPAELLLIPTEYRPPADAPDLPVDMLAKAKGFAADCGQYRSLVTRAIGAILAGPRKSLFDAQDKREELVSMMRPGVEQTGAELARGPDGDSRRRDFFVSREKEINDIVRREFLESATAGDDAARSAMSELEQAIAKGRRANAYAALGAPVKADEHARVMLLEREIRARSLSEFWDAFVSAAESDDLEQARLLMSAAEPWLRELLSTIPGRRKGAQTGAAAREVREGEIDRENAMINKLLDRFQDLREELVDPSLLLASEVFANLLCPALRAYSGYVTSWDLPRARFDSMTGSKLPDWSERLDDFLTRFMPWGRADYGSLDATTLARRGGADGPPGWGPRRRTSVGWERVSLNNLVEQNRLSMK